MAGLQLETACWMTNVKQVSIIEQPILVPSSNLAMRHGQKRKMRQIQETNSQSTGIRKAIYRSCREKKSSAYYSIHSDSSEGVFYLYSGDSYDSCPEFAAGSTLMLQPPCSHLSTALRIGIAT